MSRREDHASSKERGDKHGGCNLKIESEGRSGGENGETCGSRRGGFKAYGREKKKSRGLGCSYMIDAGVGERGSAERKGKTN